MEIALGDKTGSFGSVCLCHDAHHIALDLNVLFRRGKHFAVGVQLAVFLAYDRDKVIAAFRRYICGTIQLVIGVFFIDQ